MGRCGIVCLCVAGTADSGSVCVCVAGTADSQEPKPVTGQFCWRRLHIPIPQGAGKEDSFRGSAGASTKQGYRIRSALSPAPKHLQS